jgi:F-type H+-transporting ATPase subunit epsilon
MAESMNVKVVSPESSVYEGPASSLVAPAWDGRVGILPGHAPMLTLLGAGELAVDIPGGGSETFYVAGGVLQVEGGVVTVLTEYAGTEPPESLPEAANFDPSDLARDAGS